MSPDGVLSENQKQIRFRKLIQRRRILGEPIPKSYQGNEEDESKRKPEIVHHFGQGKSTFSTHCIC